MRHLSLVLVVVAAAALVAPAAQAKWATSGGSGAALMPLGQTSEPMLARVSIETVTVRTHEFQWVDAGLGAATVFAGVMLVGGIVLASRRHRSTARPT
jgi:hypothetical protein